VGQTLDSEQTTRLSGGGGGGSGTNEALN